MTPSVAPQNELDVRLEAIRIDDFLLARSGQIADVMTKKIVEALIPFDARDELTDHHLHIAFNLPATGHHYDQLQRFLAKICAREFCEIKLAENATTKRGRRARHVFDFKHQEVYDNCPEFKSLVSDYTVEMATSTWRQGLSHNLYAKDLITQQAFRVHTD